VRVASPSWPRRRSPASVICCWAGLLHGTISRRKADVRRQRQLAQPEVFALAAPLLRPDLRAAGQARAGHCRTPAGRALYLANRSVVPSTNAEARADTARYRQVSPASLQPRRCTLRTWCTAGSQEPNGVFHRASSAGGVTDRGCLWTAPGTAGRMPPPKCGLHELTTSPPVQLTDYNEAPVIAEIDGGQAAISIINALHTRPNAPFSSSDPRPSSAGDSGTNRSSSSRAAHTRPAAHLPLSRRRTPTHQGGTYRDQRCPAGISGPEARRAVTVNWDQ
jgi:hypothetical protein